MSLKSLIFLSPFILFGLLSQSSAKEGVVFRDSEALFQAELLAPLKESIFDIEYAPSGERFLYMGKSKNESHMVLGMRGSELITIKYDNNGDHFYEYVERKGLSGRFFKEVLKASKEKFYSYRERQYRTNSFQVKIIFEKRNSEGDKFKKVGERVEFAFQAMGSDLGNIGDGLNELSAPSCRLGMGLLKIDDKRLISDMSEIKNYFNLNDAMVRSDSVAMVMEIDKSCDDSLEKTIGGGEKKPFQSIVQESLTEGMKCLKGITENQGSLKNGFNSSADIMYVRAGARILGSHLFDDHTSINDGPDVNHPRYSGKKDTNNTKLQFVCAEEEDFFRSLNVGPYEDGVAIGYASIEPGQSRKIQCEGNKEVTLSHPYISLNMRKVLGDAGERGTSRSEARTELKKLIFHEFLHTTGISHNPVYDPIGACAEYCFGRNSDKLRDKCKGVGTVKSGVTSVINRIGANLLDLSGNSRREAYQDSIEYLKSTNEFNSGQLSQIQSVYGGLN